MSRMDKLVSSVLLSLSACFAIKTFQEFQARRPLSEPKQTLARPLHITEATAIGPRANFLGNAASPYTLIEFGDYQCPPCHAAAAKIPELLERYSGRLKFTFRNFPLTGIHSSAMKAALIAECARYDGTFWKVHDALYNIDPSAFDDHSMDLAVANCYKGRNPQFLRYSVRAHEQVQQDVRTAELMGVDKTPSFVLCTPGGKVLLLSDLSQLQRDL
jgi:protein-disulfide isomerase